MKNKILMLITTILLTIWMCFSSCDRGPCIIYYFQDNGKGLTSGYYKETILRLQAGDSIFLSEGNNWVGYTTEHVGIIDTIICSE